MPSVMASPHIESLIAATAIGLPAGDATMILLGGMAGLPLPSGLSAVWCPASAFAGSPSVPGSISFGYAKAEIIVGGLPLRAGKNATAIAAGFAQVTLGRGADDGPPLRP